MATERQINANRENARKSTGPRTPEGKGISSKNAAHLGLHSSTIVLDAESHTKFNGLLSALIGHFQPGNPVEMSLVENMAAARWRLLRIWGTQTLGYQMEMANQDPSVMPSVAFASAFRHLADNSHVLSVMHRYETAYDRQYQRALAMLLKLRKTPDCFATESLDINLEDKNLKTEANFNHVSESEPASPEEVS